MRMCPSGLSWTLRSFPEGSWVTVVTVIALLAVSFCAALKGQSPSCSTACPMSHIFLCRGGGHFFLLVELGELGPGDENLFAGETGGTRGQPRPLLTSSPFASLLGLVWRHVGCSRLGGAGSWWACLLCAIGVGQGCAPPPSLPASRAQAMGCGQSRGPAGEGRAPETHGVCSARCAPFCRGWVSLPDPPASALAFIQPVGAVPSVRHGEVWKVGCGTLTSCFLL